MGAGILPVALYRGTLYLLMGRERNDNLWIDFGGTPNKGEKPLDTAIREGGEELNGFLGNDKELEKTINANLIISICYDKYTTHIFRTKYNSDLPIYFHNSNKFAEKYLKDKVNKKHNGLFEKKEIQWFKISQLKHRKALEFIRPWYHELINVIIKKENLIIKEIENMSDHPFYISPSEYK